jgi:hypothetical protein
MLPARIDCAGEFDEVVGDLEAVLVKAVRVDRQRRRYPPDGRVGGRARRSLRSQMRLASATSDDSPATTKRASANCLRTRFTAAVSGGRAEVVAVVEIHLLGRATEFLRRTRNIRRPTPLTAAVPARCSHTTVGAQQAVAPNDDRPVIVWSSLADVCFASENDQTTDLPAGPNRANKPTSRPLSPLHAGRVTLTRAAAGQAARAAPDGHAPGSAVIPDRLHLSSRRRNDGRSHAGSRKVRHYSH